MVQRLPAAFTVAYVIARHDLFVYVHFYKYIHKYIYFFNFFNSRLIIIVLFMGRFHSKHFNLFLENIFLVFL